MEFVEVTVFPIRSQTFAADTDVVLNPLPARCLVGAYLGDICGYKTRPAGLCGDENN